MNLITLLLTYNTIFILLSSKKNPLVFRRFRNIAKRDY